MIAGFMLYLKVKLLIEFILSGVLLWNEVIYNLVLINLYNLLIL